MALALALALVAAFVLGSAWISVWGPSITTGSASDLEADFAAVVLVAVAVAALDAAGAFFLTDLAVVRLDTLRVLFTAAWVVVVFLAIIS